MKGFRLWLGACLALLLAACGNGSVKSPDFISELQSIQLNPAGPLSGGTGQSVQLQAIGTFTAPPGSPVRVDDITTKVTWASGNSNIASVTPTGLLTYGAQLGSTTITASKKGVSRSLTVTNQGVILLSVVIDPNNRVVAPNGSASFTALGLYSDSNIPREMPVDETISWTWVSGVGGTISNGAAGKTVTVTANATEGVYPIRATNNVQNKSGDANFIVGQVTGLTVTPNPTSSPVGIPKTFTARATFATTTGGGTIPPQEVDAIWSAAANTGTPPSIDSNCDSVAEARSTCNITGRTTGQVVTVTAAYAQNASITGTATMTIDPAVLTKVVIESQDPSVVIDPVTRTVSLGVGAAPSFVARYFYSDDVNDLAPRSAGDKVAWTNSTPAVGTLSVDPNTNVAKVTTIAKGETDLTAASPAAGSLPDTITLDVGDATAQALVRVEPTTAFVIQGRTQEFVAIGRFSDNSEAPLSNSVVTWSSDSAAVATQVGSNTGVFRAGLDQAGNSTLIRATSSIGSATANFIVTENRCAIPLRAADAATVAAGPTAGVIVPIIANGENLIDIDPEFLTFGSITSVLGVLNAYAGFDVFGNNNPLYSVPFAAGYAPGFIISLPRGPLVLAELLKQVQISTLAANGDAIETSGDLVPLRVDLLGTQLIGGVPQDQLLVAIDTTQPFTGVRLRVKSGTATALSQVNVFGACADTEPPVPELNGIDRLEVVSPAGGLTNNTTSVGSPINLDAFNLDDERIPDADVTWTSDDVGNPPTADGVFTPDSPGTVVLTATLKDQSLCGANCSASYSLNVVPSFCETKLIGEVSHTAGPLCLLCTVNDESNIADSADATFGTLVLPVSLLTQNTLTVNVDVPLQTPTGNRVGFLVTTSASNVLLASLIDQVVVRTTLNGEPTGESSDSILNPLNLDLLGVDADGFQYGTVSITNATQPYDGVQFEFSSLLTVLSLNSLRINSTCANVVSPDDFAP